MSSSSSEWSSEEENAHGLDENVPQPFRSRQKARISVAISHTRESIQTLYRLGSLLRRPGLSGRYLHSEQARATEDATYNYDLSHVRQKIHQWLHDGNHRVAVGVEGELAVSEEIISQRLEEKETPIYLLCKRLAAANTRRREQFRYWSQHPYHPDTPFGQENTQLTEILHQENKRRPVHVAVRGAFQQGEGTTPSESSVVKSVTTIPTVQTFSSVTKSAIFETDTESGPPRTIYAETVVGDRVSTRVPDLPAAAQRGEPFECPYCHMNLEIKDRLVWKYVSIVSKFGLLSMIWAQADTRL